MKYILDWFEANKVVGDFELPTTQVYCWVYASDHKLALVSKDNQTWQLPGGKPKENENSLETLQRELEEETSLNLRELKSIPKMFGYYVVTEIKANGQVVKKYLQLRYLVKLDQDSQSLKLTPNENQNETGNDEIKFAQWYSISEAKQLVPWLADSSELRSFLKY